MDLVSLLIFIIIIGVIIWLINYLPIDQKIKTVVIVLVVIIAIIWLLNGLGAIGGHPYYFNFRR